MWPLDLVNPDGKVNWGYKYVVVLYLDTPLDVNWSSKPAHCLQYFNFNPASPL